METLTGVLNGEERIIIEASQGPYCTYLASSPSPPGHWAVAAPGPSASSCCGRSARPVDPYAQPSLCHLIFLSEMLP